MHLRLLCVVGVVAGSLSACATPTYNYRSAATEISAPPLNIEATAMVGDNMLQQGKYEEVDAIILRETVKVGTIGTYTFSPGHYVKRGQNSKGEFYNQSSLPGSGSVTTGAITDPFESLLLEPDGTTLCGVSVFGAKVCRNNIDVRRTKVPNLTADAFQQTLIYSGRVGDKINVGYREFSGNLARPAFNNDVEYDLGDSKQIGYKGAVIEVVEATNRYIRYVVRQNFNPATR